MPVIFTEDYYKKGYIVRTTGSDRTVAQDKVLATGQAALAMINGSMVDQSLKNNERWING